MIGGSKRYSFTVSPGSGRKRLIAGNHDSIASIHVKVHHWGHLATAELEMLL